LADHETFPEDGVEISPGATLGGLIRVGACRWIAPGATVPPMVRIGENAVVGAGSVVNRDVSAGTTVVGIPAKAK
jgi:acetyltransferase-like isoleucine patch superfamily enzyme